jgi:hypothetical protein
LGKEFLFSAPNNKKGDFQVMNTVNLKLMKASLNKSLATKSEHIPSNFFDPIARKQSKLRVAILLVDCLNSYIRNPLFHGKPAVRRSP